MEPPNKGHVGTGSCVLYREVSFIRRLKCTGIIGIGTSRFVLYREVFFIGSVLYWRFHCNCYTTTLHEKKKYTLNSIIGLRDIKTPHYPTNAHVGTQKVKGGEEMAASNCCKCSSPNGACAPAIENVGEGLVFRARVWRESKSAEKIESK